MVNNDILEGLRNALARGYPLKVSMVSFLNAGYKKEEIEEAARALHEPPSQPLSHPQKTIPKELEKPVKKPITSEPSKPKPVEAKLEEQKPIQTVSKYQEKPKGNLKLILLIIGLFLVIVGLVASILFRNELVVFFRNLF